MLCKATHHIIQRYSESGVVDWFRRSEEAKKGRKQAFMTLKGKTLGMDSQPQQSSAELKTSTSILLWHLAVVKT